MTNIIEGQVVAAADNAAKEGLESVQAALTVAPVTPITEAAKIVVAITQEEYPFLQDALNTLIGWGFKELGPVLTKVEAEAEKIWTDIKKDL